MSLDEELNSKVGIMASVDKATEDVNYAIWGAAVTTTRAFEKVTLTVDANTNRVFVKIKLRWVARHKRLAPLHQAWLARAERRCKEYLPTNWRILVYYDKN